jgi:hypothetical protein
VNLLGASSANCPMDLRAALWQRLGSDLRPPALERMASRTVPLAGVVEACGSLMNRAALGRVLVDLRDRV